MKRFLLALLIVLLPYSPIHAWGEYGHTTIADISHVNISPTAKLRMQALFRAAPLLGTPKCPLKNIRDASVWPDCVRRDQLRWSYTNAWHYQNVDICKPFDLKTPCAGGNCVSAQIDRNYALLKDKALPANVRLEALAFLVHFVGDLHQPLHAGDRSDRGGNDVKANYGVIPGSNLHSVWDGALAERSISAAPSLVRRYSTEQRALVGTGNSAAWSEEAWQLSRDNAYPRALDGDPCGIPTTHAVTIDEADVAASRETLRLQVRRAGLRLASLLDAALN